MRNSTKSRNRLKLAVVAVLSVVALVGYWSNSTRQFKAEASVIGPSPSYTGAPDEQNCTFCHSDFAANSGGGSIVITGMPKSYTPGSSYPLTLTVNQFNAVLFGFQAVSLDRTLLQAGFYNFSTTAPVQLKTVDTVFNGQTRRYLEHTQAGTTSNVFNQKTWNFNWVAPATRRGKVSLYAAGNGANSDGGSGGDFIYTTSVCSTSGAMQTGANFDADSKADISVFRPSNGAWYRLNSSNGQFNAVQFGANGDKIVPGDFDGDGRTDTVVYRPSNGVWYILRSSDGGFASYQFGASGDIPVVGDYTGDGKAELAVFRPAIGTFYTLNLVNGGFASTQYGANGDKPVSGDFDGDGKSDHAVFRPSTGAWFYLQSGNSQSVGVQFGAATDKASPADYDGDGKTDVAVFRPSNGTWYLLLSNSGFSSVQFGTAGDIAAPADYDGDCIADLAVYRSGNFYVLNSTNGAVSATAFGVAGDIPIAAGYTTEVQ